MEVVSMKCREEKWQPTIGDKFILVASGEKVNAIRRPDAKGIDKFCQVVEIPLNLSLEKFLKGFLLISFLHVHTDMVVDK